MTNLTIITPFPPNITGIGQYGFHVSRSLAQTGQFSQITVLAGAQAPLSRPVTSPSFSVKYAWQPDQLGAIPAILSAVYRSRPDLVWFNMGVSVFGRSPLANLFGLASLGMIQSAGIPVVATLH